MLKTTTRETDESQALRQCKWRNLLFDKSGKSYLGKILVDSAEAARKRLELSINTLKSYNDGRDRLLICLDCNLNLDNYAWSMQIPVMQP